jgi:signal transduction histidine kinase
MSFRLKTILGIAFIEAVLLSLLVSNILAYLNNSNEKQLVDRVSTTLVLFATASKDAVIATDLATLVILTETVIANPDLVYAKILDADGMTLAQRGDELALSRPQITMDQTIDDATDGIFDASTIIEESGIPYGQVQIGFDTSRLQATIDEARQHAIIIAAVEMVLVALFSLILGIYLTRQLTQLTKASEAIAKGDLGHQVAVKGRDEIATTIKAFNHMSAQIQADIEQLNEKHNELISARDMAEEASHSKSLFLSNMSHELRTPLNAIIGFAQVLELDDLDASQRDSVEEIHKAGLHLLELINQVLDLAKIEAGKMTVSLGPIMLGQLLAQCHQLLVPLMEKFDVEVESDDWDSEISVIADQPRLKQVIINLLSNAIKFNRKNGKVRISLTPSDDNYYRIAVSDEGQGIPEHQMTKLFQPFNRLIDEKDTTEGTGIGLVISKHLIDLMNGHIGVESQPGVGSTFWIELPIAEAEQQNEV